MDTVEKHMQLPLCFGCCIFGIAPDCHVAALECRNWFGKVATIVLWLLGVDPLMLVQYLYPDSLSEDCLLKSIMHHVHLKVRAFDFGYIMSLSVISSNMSVCVGVSVFFAITSYLASF